MSLNFTGAGGHTDANRGRVGGGRQAAALSAGIGKAKTLPSRNTTSRQTSGGMLFDSRRVSTTEEASSDPWKVSLVTDGDDKKATIGDGVLFDSLLGFELLEPVITNPSSTVSVGDVVCLEYNHLDDTIANAIIPEDDFEPFTLDEEAPPNVVTSRWPLAQVVDIAKEGDEEKLGVQQIVTRNAKLVTACVNGQAVKYFVAV